MAARLDGRGSDQGAAPESRRARREGAPLPRGTGRHRHGDGPRPGRRRAGAHDHGGGRSRHRLHVRARGDDRPRGAQGRVEVGRRGVRPGREARRGPVPRRLPDEHGRRVAREARAVQHLPPRHPQRRAGRGDRPLLRASAPTSWTGRSPRSRSTPARSKRSTRSSATRASADSWRRRGSCWRRRKSRDGRATRALPRPRLGSEARPRVHRRRRGHLRGAADQAPRSAGVGHLGRAGGPRRRRDPRPRRSHARGRAPRVPQPDHVRLFRLPRASAVLRLHLRRGNGARSRRGSAGVRTQRERGGMAPGAGGDRDRAGIRSLVRAGGVRVYLRPRAERSRPEVRWRTSSR